MCAGAGALYQREMLSANFESEGKERERDSVDSSA